MNEWMNEIRMIEKSRLEDSTRSKVAYTTVIGESYKDTFEKIRWISTVHFSDI